MHTVTTQLRDTYEEMKGKMLESLTKFQKEGSGLQLHSIEGLDISIAKFKPLNGAGYSKLPPFIAKKKAIINMKNEKCKEGDKHCECEKCEESKMCFKWAVTRALNPVNRDSERVTKELREQAKKYNWDGIEFPVKVKDIHIWEKDNENKININVFGYDEDTKKVYTIRMSDDYTNITLDEGETQNDKFINLFLHDDNHFCVVKNLSRLVYSQYNKHKAKSHFCLFNVLGQLQRQACVSAQKQWKDTLSCSYHSIKYGGKFPRHSLCYQLGSSAQFVRPPSRSRESWS